MQVATFRKLQLSFNEELYSYPGELGIHLIYTTFVLLLVSFDIISSQQLITEQQQKRRNQPRKIEEGVSTNCILRYTRMVL